MSEINENSPLLAEYEVLQQISQNKNAAVYVVKSKVSGRECVLKHISIPESQTQIEGLKLSGAVASDEEASAYYAQVLHDLVRELKTLDKLSELAPIAGAISHCWEEKTEGIGYDLYIFSEKRVTLEQYLLHTAMTHQKAVNLAVDLCDALARLRQTGLLHAGIKPSNIYLNNQGHFILGDLGLYRLDQLRFASVPDHMLGDYAAPEMFEIMAPVNETTDIYAIGLILYDIFNGGHKPYVDERTTGKEAETLRLSGAPMPAPLYADYEMAKIILKACAYQPENRYTSPDELKSALSDYMLRNDLRDDLIVPPIVADADMQVSEEAMQEQIEPARLTNVEELEEEFVNHLSPDTDTLNDFIESVKKEEAEENASAEQSAEAEEAVPEVAPEPEEVPAEPEAPVELEASAEPEAPAEQEAPAEPEATEEPEAPAEEPAPIPSEETPKQSPPEVKTKQKKKKGKKKKQAESTEANRKNEAAKPKNEATAKPVKQKEPNLSPEPEKAPAEPPMKRRIPLWIPILAALLILAAAAILAWNILVPSISAVSVEKATSGEIVLKLESNQPQASTVVTCADTYGNTYTGKPENGCYVFSELDPGTLYTFAFRTTFGLQTGNIHSFTQATQNSTDVLHFHAKPVSETQVQLNFAVSGADCAQWTVTYTDDSGAEASKDFSGHSILIADLKPNAHYTFRLSAKDASDVTGKTELEYDTTVRTTVTRISAVYSEGQLMLSWDYDGDTPTQWNITCTGEDGVVTTYTKENGTSKTLDHLEANKTYTIELYCDGMQGAALKTIRTGTVTIHDLNARQNEQGLWVVSWQCDGDAEADYILKATRKDGSDTAPITAEGSGTSATLSGLLPESQYLLELSAQSGSFGGETTLSIETGAAEHFSDYGCASAYLGLFLKPDKENWGAGDLSQARTVFSTSELPAFALQALSGRSASEDSVTRTVVIRNADGSIVAEQSSTEVWDALWDRDLCVGAMSDPLPTAGSYTMSIYFNGKLAASQSFSVQA